MTAIRVRSLPLMLALAAAPSLALAGGKAFPGTDVARSPDRKWELRSEPPTNDEGHKLQLRAVADGSVRQVLSFRRHVNALWAPDSKRIAVTDYEGSDSSECRIVDVNTGKPTSVSDALKGTSLESLIARNHHAYVKCLRWRSPTVVEIEIDAYGDANPKGIKKRAQFDTTSAKVARQ
jgi:WD40 repeat protein